VRKLLFVALIAVAGVAVTGCEPQKVSGSTAPLSDEERRKIAEQDKQIEEEESPGNKTLKPKGGKK
jgi:hypothetical protein